MNLTATRSGRRFVFGALYLSEGAPIGFIWWALPTVLAAEGETVDDITAFVGLLLWPWTMKFLWAPLVDALRGPRWGHRYWILAAQLVMGASMAPLIFLDVPDDLTLIFWLLMLHAAAATTQDVAIDGWAISITPKHEHGRLNASMTVGKFAGRWLFGSGLLIVWEWLGRPLVIGALIGCIWATAVLVMLSADVRQAEETPGARLAVFRRSLRRAATQRLTWVGVLFALISGAAFEAVGAVARPMLVERGYETAAIGWWSTGWLAAMVVGAWVGGFTADRWGHRRCVAIFLIALSLATWLVCGADLLVGDGSAAWVIGAAILVPHIGIGLFWTTSYALYMDLTDPRIAGTHFSTFMGATNGCEMWAGVVAGQLIAAAGYAVGLACLGGVSLLALPLLAMLPEQNGDSDPSAAHSPAHEAGK